MAGKEMRFERNGDKVKVLYGEWDFCLPAADLRGVRRETTASAIFSNEDTSEMLRILDGAIAFAVKQGMIPAEEEQ